MKNNNTIDSSWTVNDVIETFPDSISVLNSLGVDSCCGGHLTLSEAASESTIDIHTLLAGLETCAGKLESAS